MHAYSMLVLSLHQCMVIALYTIIIFIGEFGIVYKGCLTGQYMDKIVAIKILKGVVKSRLEKEC